MTDTQVSAARQPRDPTFLVQLQDGRRWGGHLHGQTVGTSEGVAVPDDERARLFVLQHGDG